MAGGMSTDGPEKPVFVRVLRGLGLAAGVLVVVLVASYFFAFRPAQNEMVLKSKRIDVAVNMAGIRSAMLAYKEAEGHYFSIEKYPATTDTQRRSWAPDASSGFNKLGWTPSMPEVFGSYWVKANKDDFTIHGICDIDGDGVFAKFIATSTTKPTLTTEGAF